MAVYYLIQEDHRFIKIGFGKSALKRKQSLQVGNPHELEIIAQEVGDKNLETIRHEQFRGLRIRGEWFRYEEPLISHIGRLQRGEIVSGVELSENIPLPTTSLSDNRSFLISREMSAADTRLEKLKEIINNKETTR